MRCRLSLDRAAQTPSCPPSTIDGLVAAIEVNAHKAKEEKDDDSGVFA